MTEPQIEAIETKEMVSNTESELRQIYLPAILRRLPDVRHSITHKFCINGHEGVIIVGLYEDMRPGELFIKMSKSGSTISGLMDSIGILTSIALQHGVPLGTLVSKLEHTRFEPSGWTPHAGIGHASSVVDYIFRWLGCTFAGLEDLRIQPTDPSSGSSA